MLCRGKALLSRIDPVTQAERIAEAQDVKPLTLYLVPRPLFGYGLAAFLQKLPQSSRILALETDEALFEWTRRNIEHTLFAGGRFSLMFAPSPGMFLLGAGNLFLWRDFRRVELFANSGAWQYDAPAFDALLDAAQTELAQGWSNAMTLTRLGRLFARNAFHNLPLLAHCPSADRLNFGADSTLVAGAGPSLEEAARELSSTGRYRGERWRIVAVDTALPALFAWGIKPDLVVALESQHWNAGDFTGLYGQNIPLAMDFSALPLTARVFAGAPYLFWTEWTPLRFFDRLNAAGLLPLPLPALGSVGLSAYALACRLTTGRVAAAGLDFAFTADLYHCRASPSHRRLLRENSRFHSMYPLASVYREGSFSLAGRPDETIMLLKDSSWRSDPSLARYRTLFAGLRGRNLETTGFLSKTKRRSSPAEPDWNAFAGAEQERLEKLLDILAASGNLSSLDSLLDECDYLWAHFPECAGKNGWRPPISNTGFLKRVRAEIEPFLRILRNAPPLIVNKW